MKKNVFFALFAIVALAFVGCEPPVVPVDYTVNISATELTMELGSTQKLTAVANPTTTATLAWTSSNDSVVTVDASGIVTATGLGTATITVTLNVAAEDATVGQVTPATCVINVTNDAVLDNFVLGGYGLFDLGDPIPGTDTIIEISVGEVKCQLAPSLYYVWDEGIVLVNNRLSGAGFILPIENYTLMIVEGDYAGYYISGFDIVVDTIADDDIIAYTGKAGQLLDVNKYGDAWDALLNATEETPEEEINAAYDLYYESQTGTPFFHIDLNTGNQSFYYGNVSYLYLAEDRETAELYYNLKLEWYDHVNLGRWFGLLCETELNEEDGLEYITGLDKPYDMRLINKQYLVLPPAEEEETTEVKALQPMKPIRLNAKQAEFLKSTTRMYKK